MELTATPHSGLTPPDGRLAITIRAAAVDRREISGDLIVVVGDAEVYHASGAQTLGPAETTVELPMQTLTRRWDVLPIYMAFVAADDFAAAETPLYYSHLLPTAAKPFVPDAKGWLEWEGYKPAASTVGDVQVSVGKQSVRVEFAWRDETPVPARTAPYTARLGQPVTTPLDMSSPFGQPCDAVEVLLDLRDERSSGRCTANMDSLPDGTIRIGLYKIEEAGRTVCKLGLRPSRRPPR